MTDNPPKKDYEIPMVCHEPAEFDMAAHIPPHERSGPDSPPPPERKRQQKSKQPGGKRKKKG